MRRGFTLVEAVLALGITALVLTALYGALGRAAVARERGIRSVDRTATVQAVLLRVAHEIEAAIPPGDVAASDRFTVGRGREEAAPWWSLRFASWVGGGDGRALAYRVDPAQDPSAAGVLVRRATSRFAPPERDGGQPAVLLDRVRAFRIRCFDGERWRASWKEPTLPRAVEISIAVEDDTGAADEVSTTVTLPVRAPS